MIPKKVEEEIITNISKAVGEIDTKKDFKTYIKQMIETIILVLKDEKEYLTPKQKTEILNFSVTGILQGIVSEKTIIEALSVFDSVFEEDNVWGGE